MVTSAAESILIVHLAGIGDLLMGRLALEQLRQACPRSRIVLLTWTRNLEAAALIPSVSECCGLELGGWGATLVRNLKTALQLRSQRFDLALNGYQVYRQAGVVKLALLLGVIRARDSAGRDTDGKGWCFAQRVRERFQDPLHEVERQSRFVEALGCQPVLGPAPLSIPMADQHAADVWLTHQGLTGGTPFAALHPGGARPGHRWPAASFARVAQGLQERGLRVVITGGAGEQELAQTVAKPLRQPAIATGQLSFGQLAHLLRRSRLFITNDSGPMHLAASLKVPLVAIFGPGDPNRYGPYPLDRPDQIVVHAIGDPICFRAACKGHQPLRHLPVEPVLEAVNAILNSEHPSGIRSIASPGA